MVLRPPTAFEMLVSWPPRPLTALVIVANDEVIPDSDAWTAASVDWTDVSEDWTDDSEVWIAVRLEERPLRVVPRAVIWPLMASPVVVTSK